MAYSDNTGVARNPLSQLQMMLWSTHAELIGTPSSTIATDIDLGWYNFGRCQDRVHTWKRGHLKSQPFSVVLSPEISYRWANLFVDLACSTELVFPSPLTLYKST